MRNQRTNANWPNEHTKKVVKDGKGVAAEISKKKAVKKFKKLCRGVAAGILKTMAAEITK